MVVLRDLDVYDAESSLAGNYGIMKSIFIEMLNKGNVSNWAIKTEQ